MHGHDDFCDLLLDCYLGISKVITREWWKMHAMPCHAMALSHGGCCCGGAPDISRRRAILAMRDLAMAGRSSNP